MEYCAGGSLADFIDCKSSSKEPVSEGYVLNIFHQINAALLYCHEGLMADSMSSPEGWNSLLHRDIKPGNSKFLVILKGSFLTMLVLLSSSNEAEQVIAKLADFGLSTVVQEGRDPSTYTGTKRYLAPVGCLYPSTLSCLKRASPGNRLPQKWLD